MKGLSLFLTGAFTVLAISSFASGEVYEGMLELIIAIHNLSDYLEAK